ncbi:uncharacterized protein DS421_8g252950 [Arachis hypogaea]|nr:uncharacterized protein DS421_8g252950 [Arachis hypogaea]
MAPNILKHRKQSSATNPLLQQHTVSHTAKTKIQIKSLSQLNSVHHFHQPLQNNHSTILDPSVIALFDSVYALLL